MFEMKFTPAEVCRFADVSRSRFENWSQRQVIQIPPDGPTLATAELLAVLNEISNALREKPAMLSGVSSTLATAIEYELSPPRGGWGDARTLHRCWGRARAGEEAWLVVVENSAGGLELEPFESLDAAVEFVRDRSTGAPHLLRLVPMHRILADVGRRFHARNDRVERIGAGMFILRAADGSEKLLEEVEELEA